MAMDNRNHTQVVSSKVNNSKNRTAKQQLQAEHTNNPAIDVYTSTK